MKNNIATLATLFATMFIANGQITSTNISGKGDYLISYATFSISPDGSLGREIRNYQAMVRNNRVGNKYLIVSDSKDWLKGNLSTPKSLALYLVEIKSAMHVVLDYEKRTFKFFPWNTKIFNGPPDFINRELSFLGSDGRPYTISFEQFVGINRLN